MNQMNGMACSSFVARASRWRNWVVTTACVAALSACGGGGSSSSTAPVEHSRVVVSTLATHNANGPVTFGYLGGIARDPSTGNLYVSDTNADRIFMVTPDGLVTLVAGGHPYGSANGDGTQARFWTPLGIAVDVSGALYVADDGNNTIRKLVNTGDKSDPTAWTVTTFAGSVNGYQDTDTAVPPVPPTSARFSGPSDMVVDANANVLYVADTVNGRIRKIDLSTPDGAVSTLAGNGQVAGADGSGVSASFNGPFEVRLDVHGGLYVADTNGLRHVSATGYVTTIGSLRGGYAQDSAGNFYVVNDGDDTLRMVTPSGQMSILVGAAGRGRTDGTGDVAQLYSPLTMVLDEANKTLYVIEYDFDTHQGDIRKIVLP